jgi:hypothetical protein
MKQIVFYSRIDPNKEPIGKTISFSRLQAAKYFAKIKQLELKAFLKIYGVKFK